MSIKTGKTWILAPLSLSIMLALTGCWFDDSSSISSSNSAKTDTPKDETLANSTTLTGTAAIGAPLVGANVSLNCAGYNKSNATTTGNTGNWNFAVPTANLPCVVNVAGGTANNVANTQNLYGLSLGNQTNVNITPLTTLALAGASNNALGLKLEDLFKAANIDFSKLAAQIDAAVNKLKNDLTAQGFNYPNIVDFNPFFTAFDPQAGNSYDDLLEAVMAAIQAANSNLAALTTTYATGGALPSPLTTPSPNPNPNPNPNPTRELGLATLTAYSTENQEKFFAGVTGTYPVAIYRAPAGKESHIGEGSLTISGTTDNWSMSLKAANGDIISSLTSKSVFVKQLTPFIGQLFLNGGTTPDRYLNAFVKTNGFIEGTAGGEHEYGFRNNIVAYGSKVPEVFSKLTGRWKGTTAYTLCGVTDVVMDITAEGKITNTGTNDTSCKDASQSLTWNGNDDIIVLEQGVYNIMLDAKPNGTGNINRITLTLDDLTKTPEILGSLTNVPGGAFKTKNAKFDTSNSNDGNNGSNNKDGLTAEEKVAKARLAGQGGISGIWDYDGTKTPFTYTKSRTNLKYTITNRAISIQYDDAANSKANMSITFPPRTGTYPCAKSYTDFPDKGKNTSVVLFASGEVGQGIGAGSTCTVKAHVTADIVEGTVFSENATNTLVKGGNVKSVYFYHAIEK